MADHLSVIIVGDDSFDVDQGYTGINQSLLSISTFFNALIVDPRTLSNTFGPESGDKSCECDGDDIGSSTPPGDLINNASVFSGLALGFSGTIATQHDPLGSPRTS